MAITGFREIIQNKAYRISAQDRQIFERESLQSFFGLSDDDVIEFILYDVNNNQLPQLNDELVRYIPLNSENISDYFLIETGTELQRFQLPTEYFIDVERLITEAGYTNGIFRTQITLLNKRVGSSLQDDKLWISEISPSRTEVRLLPIRKPNSDSNLKSKFDVFIQGLDFKSDTILPTFRNVEKINVIDSFSNLLEKYSESFIDTFKTEYKVEDVEILLQTIYNKFSESVIFELTGRISDINDVNYGKRKTIEDPTGVSIDDIKSTLRIFLTRAIQKFLYEPNVTDIPEYSLFTDPSLDEVGEILQKRESDIRIDTVTPEVNLVQDIKIEQTTVEIQFQQDVLEEVPDELGDQISICTPSGDPIPFNTGGGGEIENFTDRLIDVGIDTRTNDELLGNTTRITQERT
jgi:hypothetical protein